MEIAKNQKPVDGKYPVIIDGETSGELTVTSVGIMTQFEAFCKDCGSIMRLSVYGEEDGREGYLGVMIPEGGMLRFRKKLSRSSMADFPSDIAYAGPAGFNGSSESVITLPNEDAPVTIMLNTRDSESVETSEVLDNTEIVEVDGIEAADPDITEVSAVQSDSIEILSDVSTPLPDVDVETVATDVTAATGVDVTIWKPAPNPWSMFSNTLAKMALRNVRGALSTTSKDGRTYLAIPGDSKQDALADFEIIETRNIEGIVYSVVETE